VESLFISSLYCGKSAESISQRRKVPLNTARNLSKHSKYLLGGHLADTFRTLIDVMGVEPPTTKPALEIWHETQPGFGVRIMKRRSDGKVRRTYISRVAALQPNGTFKEDKPQLGLVEDIGTGDLVLKFKDAAELAKKKFDASKRIKAGGTARLTLGDAYEKLCEGMASKLSHDSPDYSSKMKSLYGRFLSHLANRHLDDLKEAFWIDFLEHLRSGTLSVGVEPAEDGTERPALRKAASVTYALAVLNTASRLYKIGHERKGIEGEEKGWDPTRDAVKKLEAPNERDGYVQFDDIAKAWAATDQLMSPWWRDMWRVYLLTGLRDRLVMNMRFEDIDFENGVYRIQPLAPGAKRRRRKLSQDERNRPIEMPLLVSALSSVSRFSRSFARSSSWSSLMRA
jgi:hypothetical protein